MKQSTFPQFKRDFIDFLLANGALKLGDFTLKSKRNSPWFVNIGDFCDGYSTGKLGEFYAKAIIASGVADYKIYGIPEKGNALAIATAIGLAQEGVVVPWFFTRKEAKDYGEATGLTQAEKIKAWVIGCAPQDGDSIVQLDDVFTAGDAKYEAKRVLNNLGNFRLPLLVIAVDRQEVGTSSSNNSAIEEYESQTGTRVVSIVNAVEIYTYLDGLLEEKSEVELPGNKTLTRELLDRMLNYLRVYGTDAVRKALGKIHDQAIIARDKSVIPACDVEKLSDFENLVSATASVPGIGGYKIGFELGLGHGLPKIVKTARKCTDKPIIYDHQKAGTDIPDTGINFARVCSKAGVDAVILFPQAGPETMRAWIYHALNKGLSIIVGGRMTHAAYAQSEGGWLSDEGCLEMYRIAAQIGISNFVVPGNKVEVISTIREIVEKEGISADYYAPGFIAQGGSISEAAEAAGNHWHAIVGRGIYAATDRNAAAIEHTSKL